jgi:two-component system NtrC family response regulator
LAVILVIDDDALVRDSLVKVFQRKGHRTDSAGTVEEAKQKIRAREHDLVFCDVRLPDGSGLQLLSETSKRPSPPEVIIMTGYGDPDGAELAIKNGAWDYLEKPLSAKSVALAMERALQYREKRLAANRLVVLEREGIIGNSALLKPCLDLLAQASASDANVLISVRRAPAKSCSPGRSRNSAREDANFVVVDCRAPRDLVESTLFGHTRGAFTGADRARDGLIKQADKGTLFLDEIGELSPSIQKAFLRVLQERRFRPVGGGQEVSSDFRLIAATNRGLEGMAREGKFREDLLFRLRTLSIDLPPLRQCKDDIKELVLHYTAKLCGQYDQPLKGFSPDFFDILMAYDWPGNVRELIQALEKAIVTAQDEPTLFPMHLPQHIRIQLARTSVKGKLPLESEPMEEAGGSDKPLSLEEVRNAGLARIEKRYLEDLIRLTRGNIQAACRISGLSRSRLYTLLKKHKISPAR